MEITLKEAQQTILTQTRHKLKAQSVVCYDSAYSERDTMKDPFDRPARPWDLWNKNLGRVQDVIAAERYAICKECPMLLPTGNCKECGCFMSAKTKLPNAECPLHKWGQVRVSYKDEEN